MPIVDLDLEPGQKPRGIVDLDRPAEPRGLAAEVGTQFAAGAVVDLPKMVGQAMQWMSEPDRSMYHSGKSIVDSATQREEDNPWMAPQTEGRGLIGRAMSGGARALAPSLAAAVPAVLAAPFGLTAATAAGGAAAFGLFGTSQAQETYDKLLKEGVPEDEAKQAGYINLLIEGGGETLGTFAGMKLLGIGAKALGAAGMTPVQAAIKGATDTAAWMPFVKQLPKTAAVEVGTEFGQNFGEAAVERAYGATGGETPLQAGVHGAEAALGMTALLAPFGLGGFALRAKRNERIANALQDPETPPEQRIAASKLIYGELSDVDPQAAKVWATNSAIAISAKAPIVLDETFTKPEAGRTIEERTAAAVTRIGQAETIDEAIAAAHAATSEPLYESDVAQSVGQGLIGGQMDQAVSRAERAAREQPAYDQAAQAAAASKERDLSAMVDERRTIDADAAIAASQRAEAEQPARPPANEAMRVAFEKATLARMEALQRAKDLAPAPSIDAAAHQAAPSPQNDMSEPTDAQKAAGNYKKGPVKLSGLAISVENPEGSTRSGVGPDGKPWSNTLRDHYGYIKGVPARAPDKEHVDVFIKPGTPENYAGDVYIVDQNNDRGRFDEPKVMIGYDNPTQAREGYLRNYAPGWKGLRNITPAPMGRFKEMLLDPDAFMHPQPFAPQYYLDDKNNRRRREPGRPVPAGAQVFSEVQAVDKERKRRLLERRRADPGRDSINEWIAKRGGLDISERLDTIGDDTNQSFNASQWLFRNGGEKIDELARRAVEDGYLTQAEAAEADGGVQALKDKIRDEFSGVRRHYSHVNTTVLDQQAKNHDEEEVLRQASDYGIPTAGLELDDIRKAVRQREETEAALQETEADKEARLEREAIQADNLTPEERYDDLELPDDGQQVAGQGEGAPGGSDEAARAQPVGENKAQVDAGAPEPARGDQAPAGERRQADEAGALNGQGKVAAGVAQAAVRDGGGSERAVEKPATSAEPIDKNGSRPGDPQDDRAGAQSAVPGSARERGPGKTDASTATTETTRGVGGREAAQRDAGRNDPDRPQPTAEDQQALELKTQTEADLRAKEKQAQQGKIEERAAAQRDRNDAILTSPEGTAPPREATPKPTQQSGLFGAAASLRSAADAIEKAAGEKKQAAFPERKPDTSEPLFRRGRTAEGAGAEAVRGELVDAYGEKGIKALEDSGFLELTYSDDQRLAPIRDEMAGSEDAVYWDGKAWLLTDRMAPGQAANRLLHELGEHHGLETMLGKLGYAKLLARVETMHKGGNAAVRSAWAHVKDQYAKPNDPNLVNSDATYLKDGSPEFVSEVIAAMADELLSEGDLKWSEALRAAVSKQTWWQDLLAAVKAWLAKQGLGIRNEQDVLTLLRASLNKVMRAASEPVPIGAEPAFARPPAEDPVFSRPAIAASRTVGDERDAVGAGASSFVRDLLHSDAKFNWWHKTIGTQQHKALSNDEFKRVYDESQAFLADVSKYANEAADQAKSLLPRIDSFADFKKSSPSKADIDGATQALYSGTLWGGGSPLQGRIWSDEELRAGRAINGKVSVPAFKALDDKQIALYRQALASISKSLDELGKSLIHRLARQHDIGFDRGLNLEDVATAVRDTADGMIDVKEDQIRSLQDPEVIRQMEDAAAADAGGARAAENAKRDVRKKLERQVEKAEREIAELEKLKYGVSDIESKTAALKDKGYFPAMRFGRFAVHVVEDVKGEKTPKQHSFGLFESQTKANLAARELAKKFPGARIERGIISKEQHKLFQGMSLDALETFADYITGEDGQPLSKNPLVQGFLKAAVSDRSSLKHHVNRKGIAGYSDDLPRVLASFTVSSARTASSNYHSAEMLRLAGGIKAGDVKDEAIKLVRYLMDPQEEAQALRGFLFAQFLGGSIAHGLVNMTQPFMVTIPYLSQHTSAADAAAKIAQAATTRPEKLTGKIRDAYLRAKSEGVVSPQEIHQLRAETGGMPIAKNLALRKLSFLWGSIYAVTEQFNRSTAFLAAHRIAEEKGMADPYTFAANAVNETQFVYNKGNRPNWARGAIGATVFTFKQFSISYLELGKRVFAKDRKAFALMAMMLLAGAGMQGLPFAEDLEDLIDTIGQWMGFATNSKKAIRKWATEQLGPEMAQVLLHGVSGFSWMPVDVSNRLGLQNLIPGTGMLKLSENNKAKDVLELVGPIGQFVPTEDTMMGKALERLSKGDLMGAVKSGAPVAVQNVAKGAEMLQTGQARDSLGKNIAPVSAGEAVLKIAGLQPASVARASERVGSVMQDINLQKRMESEIAEQWARAYVDGRPQDVTAAVQKLMQWNKDNPELRIKVTNEQIRSRVKAMRMSRDERITKGASPEIRGSVREQLR